MEAEIDWSMVGLDNTSILSRLGTLVHTRQRDLYCTVAKAKIFKHSASVSSAHEPKKGLEFGMPGYPEDAVVPAPF